MGRSFRLVGHQSEHLYFTMMSMEGAKKISIATLAISQINQRRATKADLRFYLRPPFSDRMEQLEFLRLLHFGDPFHRKGQPTG